MPGHPTMKAVAAAAGVSVMTVSRALRDDTAVSAATRLRIRAVADRLGYVLDSGASNLRSQRSGFVAVIIPSLDNANFAETVGAMSARLDPAGLQVLLGRDGYDLAQEERLIAQLLQRKPEAMVVTGGNHTHAARRLLQAAGIPVIEMWDLPQDPIGHVVGFSNAAAMAPLVYHLHAQGHRKIAFIGGDSQFDTRGADRRRGVIAALTALGLDASRMVMAGPPPVSMRHGAAAMARLLTEMPDVTATIATSDLSAFGALAECQRRGVQVPGDMAVAGFGAFDISAVCHPALTTIDPFCARIGNQVGALIVQLLRRPQGGDADLAPAPMNAAMNIVPKLVTRASTQGL